MVVVDLCDAVLFSAADSDYLISLCSVKVS